METEKMNLSVLLVEDEPTTRGKIFAMLERAIGTVYQAENGEKALDLFVAIRPDIVITDIRMPRMNGLDMAKKMKELDESVQIIVTTAHNDTEFFLGAIDIGVDQYVLKPVNREMLFKTIQKCAQIIGNIQARKGAEEALKAANNLLEQKVNERTAELARIVNELQREVAERIWAEEEKQKLIVQLRNTIALVSRSEKEWQDTFDDIGDMISIQDLNYTIVRANRAFAAYKGLHPRDVIGKKCYEFICDIACPGTNCPQTRTISELVPATAEMHNPKNGKIFGMSTFPTYSRENELTGVIHVAREITGEKEREMRLIMSERLASLGQMSSGIAHEINNPLASIAGCAEGLLGRTKKSQFNPEVFENYLSIVLEEVARCKNITTSMLSLVRKTSFEKKPFNVNAAIEKTLEIIGFQGRLKNVEIVGNYGDRVPSVFGSAGELRQVLIVIITNALDAMEENGVISFTTAVEDGFAVIRISDNGPGIPEEARSRIFDAFFTTKSERGGTGLGLAIAKKIVENNNGSIDVVSTERGTTFEIRLPAEKLEETTQQAAP